MTKLMLVKKHLNQNRQESVETGDLGYKSTDEILDEVGDQWTYDEYMAMLDAIADKATEPIAKAIASIVLLVAHW